MLCFKKSEPKSKVMVPGTLDQIMMRALPRLVLFFDTPPTATDQDVIDVLQGGLDKTVSQLPFLSGRIGIMGNRNKVGIAYETDGKVQLRVSNLREKMPPYAELRERGFPPSELRDGMLCATPYYVDVSKQSPPVLALQVNLLKGGVILTLCAHHTLGDGVGTAMIIAAFAKNCGGKVSFLNRLKIKYMLSVFREEAETREYLFDGTNKTQLPDHNYSEYHDSIKPGTVAGVAGVAGMTGSLARCTYRQFVFPAAKLLDLRAEVMAKIPEGFVSTNDVFGALVWKCVTRARAHRLDPDELTQMMLPVDCRKRLKKWLTYPYLGNVAICRMSKMTVSEVLHADLNVLATKIREALDSLNESYILGLIAHAEAFEGKVDEIKPQVNYNRGADIAMNSWSAFPIYALDFGMVLGKPEACRAIPRVVDGSIKILPIGKYTVPGVEEEPEEWEVLVEMEERTMNNLLRDPSWMKYVKVVKH